MLEDILMVLINLPNIIKEKLFVKKGREKRRRKKRREEKENREKENSLNVQNKKVTK